MNAAMGSIAESTGAAKYLSSQAILSVDEMNASLQQLSEAAASIGMVTSLIGKIAAQTNLLALNAAIEAAAAGDAGRGFGVVATEVKVLSKQTASASTDISDKVRDVQARVLQAVEKMSTMQQIIAQVSEQVEAIAAAAEEHKAVTQDVAANIAYAHEKVSEANRKIALSAQSSQRIAQEIENLKQATETIRGSGEFLTSCSQDLSQVVESMQSQLAASAS